MINELRAKQRQLIAELKVVNAAMSAAELAAYQTCTHPNMKVTFSEKECPDCCYYAERSF